ncbi:bifunctional tRNA (adenosine(37)-C2)-methyltransferase TrmG/ribosomal RNA large subunit methyltransferase RlmN, partial [Francisella tularensis subsp. holarctica]|nr:bifunctional tRNA (adenosine(37)-C2)-methyltransferase TrmG/ribosomal RNA large subunit methyltransferase RlmN [Francisella tularensis subsp. holarctica]
IEDFVISIGKKKFQSRHVFMWIHIKGVIEFDDMTVLGKNLRHKIKDKAQIYIPNLLFCKASNDGNHKFLIDFCVSAVDTVFIP